MIFRDDPKKTFEAENKKFESESISYFFYFWLKISD